MAQRDVEKDSTHWFITRVTWLLDCKYEILADIGTLLISGSGIWLGIQTSSGKTVPGVLFAAGAMMYLVARVHVYREQERLSQVNKELKAKQGEIDEFKDRYEQLRLDYFTAFEDLLCSLFHNVFQLDSTERLSVYSHDGNEFNMLGRYSANPNLKKTGRGVYPDSEGCIGLAWAEGIATDCNLPNPEYEIQEYKDYLHKKWGIPKGISGTFRMKSRCFVAIAIENQFKEKIAVAVFESLKPDGVFEQDEIADVLEGYDGDRIRNFLERHRRIQPSLSYALDEGF